MGHITNEILPFCITFEYIKGIKNTLADTMSRLININSQVQQDSEPEGYEFGCYTFDTLPTSDVSNIEITQDTSVCVNDNNDANNNLLELPIDNDMLFRLQQKDRFCANILTQIEKGNIIKGQLYVIQYKLLKRYVVDGDNTFGTIVLARALTTQILRMAHDNLGHNGTHRTYTLLKGLYYWKGLKPCVTKHIQICYQCQRRNKQVVKYATLHFDVATFPMQFISMDLLGEFHPPTTKGKRYALTVIHMLTGYVFCIPLKTKTAEEVLQAYVDNVYSKFGGSMKILSDNGTEFKNKIFEQVVKELGDVYKLYTPPYNPASNGRIEGFHAFLKACISKHIAPQLEWDDLVHLACAAYNFIPSEHSKESPFYLMFGRDPILPLNTLLEPKIRYLGNDINVLSLDAIKNMFEIAATNLKLAGERGDPQDQPLSNKFQLGDTVLVQNNVKGPFDPKFIGGYRVVALKGNQVEIHPATGGLTEMKHIKHVKYILPTDRYINQLPKYSMFRRKTTLKMNPDHILDLHWKLANTYHTTSIGCTEPLLTTVVIHHVTVETISDTKSNKCGEWCETVLNTKTSTSQSK